jgi:malonyl CoA-acyl carrier protein transacylase
MSISLRSAAVKVAESTDTSKQRNINMTKRVEQMQVQPIPEDEDDFDEALDKITARDLKWFQTATSVNGSTVNESVMVDGLREVTTPLLQVDAAILLLLDC